MTRRAPLRDAAIVAATVGATIRLHACEEALTAVCDAARIAFGGAEVSIACVDAAGSELVYEAAAGNAADRIVGERLPLGRGLAGYAAVANETLAIEEVRNDPRFAVDVADRIGYLPRTMVVAPVATGDTVLGVLSILDRTQPDAQAALQLAAAFARAAAGALELQRAARSLAATVFGAAALAATDAAGRPDVAATLDALRDTAADDEIGGLAESLGALRALPRGERALAERLLADIVRYGHSSRPGRTRR